MLTFTTLPASFDLIVLPVVGLIVGSFVGLVSLRLPAGEPIIIGRSRCGQCRRPLMPPDLVPVVSYLMMGGRCRRCRSPIPVRYPLIELACAGIGLWAAGQFDGPTAVITAVLGWWLLLIALIDAEEFWLPDRLTLPLGAAGLLAAGLWSPQTLVDRGGGVVAGFVTLWLVSIIYQRLRHRPGLGSGDPILFAAAGAWVGALALPVVLLVACGIGLSVIAARMLLGQAPAATEQLPFGSYLAISLWLTWLYWPATGGWLIWG